MQSKLHGIVVYHGVELRLLVSMLFLLAIPKSLLTLKDFIYTTVQLTILSFNGIPRIMLLIRE